MIDPKYSRPLSWGGLESSDREFTNFKASEMSGIGFDVAA